MSLITTDSARLVIGCAITVHRTLGPGLFESVYEPCLAHEMTKAGLRFERQVAVPIRYGDVVFDRAFRVDFIVEAEVVVELGGGPGTGCVHVPLCPRTLRPLRRS